MDKIANKLITTTLGVTLAHSAQAVIFSTDTSSAGLVIGTDSEDSIYIDFNSMTASTSTISGYDVSINGKPGESESPSANSRNGWFLRKTTYSSTDFLIKVSEGSPMVGAGWTNASFERSVYNYSTYSYTNTGPWNSPNDGIGYFGVANGAADAWVKINYNDAANTLQLLGFGYNPAGPILAGETAAIPEPASAAAMAALLAGGVAAFGRRREKRAA